MSVCACCLGEMSTADSCAVRALHQQGHHIDLAPFGTEPGWRKRGARCGDCGVTRGGWHHPGCDIQQCPVCRRQLISCGCWFDEYGVYDDDDFDFDEDDDDDPFRPGSALVEPHGVDGNGVLTERMRFGDHDVIIHRDEVPESDITTVRGIRCTTALRTVIDVAPDVDADHLQRMVQDCLRRGLFTVDDARRRVAQPDMATRRGAELLRRLLPPAS